MSLTLQPSTLYCVATPIGNLSDITQRALDVLAGVDTVLAEDTRVTGKLLMHVGLQKSLLSVHDFNEVQRVEQVVERLKSGQSLALVSDAGTPLISDPGYKLVSELVRLGFSVVPVPGASAVITALSVAGLPTDRFSFEGFLPAKRSGRVKVLKALQQDPRTLVFYESCHRIMDALDDMLAVLGADRDMVIARELTKLHEQFYRGTVAEVIQQAQVDDNIRRGEIVLMVRGYEVITEDEVVGLSEEQILQVLLAEGLPVKQVAGITAKLTGKPKNALYKLALSMG